MGCPTSTTKFFLFFSNFIYVILAITIITIASSVAFQPLGIYEFLSIAFGCILLGIVMAGCFGVIREAIWPTWIYVGSLTIFAIGAAAFLFCVIIPSNPEKQAIEDVNQHWELVLKHEPLEMNMLQIMFKCCGKDSAQDYVHANLTIPASCYSDDTNHHKQPYEDGCIKSEAHTLKTRKSLFKYITWPLLITEILGAVLGTIMAIHFRNKARRANY